MVKNIIFERRLKDISNSDLERVKLLMQKMDTHFGTNGRYGTIGDMGTSGAMGDPLRYSGEPGRELKIRAASLEKERLENVRTKFRNEYFGQTGSTSNSFDEDYYKKWCGTTINDTQTTEVDGSRDTVNHNIQELTPEIKKHKINWKFWRK